MTITIENIRPDYDFDEGVDILTFTYNGSVRFEYLNGGHLGRADGYGNLDELADLDGRTRRAIHSRLEKWIAENKDEHFSYTIDDPDVESVEHGLNLSEGISVFLTDEAGKRLNLQDGVFGYEVSSKGDISWTDRDFGDQCHENGAYGDQGDLTRRYNLANPERAVGDIEYRLARLREEAEADLEEEDAPALTI